MKPLLETVCILRVALSLVLGSLETRTLRAEQATAVSELLHTRESSGPTAPPTESQSGTNWLLSFLLHPDFPVNLTVLAVNSIVRRGACVSSRLAPIAS